MSNFIHSSTTYEIAVLHGHDLIDAAERRRQTRRFPSWAAARRRAAETGTLLGE